MSAADPRKAFADALMDLGDSNEKVLSVSCDSGSGSGMSPFAKKYPDRMIEIGISEQTGMDVAAGLAVNGFIPIISAIAPFISMRAYEQIRNDVGYSRTNVKIIGSSSGLSHSPAGSSHQANEDIALMRTVPNMVVLNPGDCFEVEMTLKKSVEHEGPVYIRMPRHPLEDIRPREGREFVIGKAEELIKGANLVIASGTVVNDAKAAVEKLNAEGADLGLINACCVWPLDADLILDRVKNAKLVVTVEEHSTVGGLGEAVASLLADALPRSPNVLKLGIAPGAANTGPYRDLIADYGLADGGIAASIRERLKKLG